MYVCIYYVLHIYIYMYICICMYIHIYVYTHNNRTDWFLTGRHSLARIVMSARLVLEVLRRLLRRRRIRGKTADVIILYYTILYYTILYYTILYYQTNTLYIHMIISICIRILIHILHINIVYMFLSLSLSLFIYMVFENPPRRILRSLLRGSELVAHVI